MNEDPFSWVRDAPLFVVPKTLERLRAFRDAPKPASVSEALERLVERLLGGIEAHPTRFWVLKQFQPVLEAVRDEDAAARAQCRTELERLMGILGIENSDGLLERYLGDA